MGLPDEGAMRDVRRMKEADAGSVISRWKPYCQLIRLPNLFTAMADILGGFWLVGGGLTWSWRLMLLMPASAALYAAGIVWNDLHDIENDRAERPGRPLPSGRLSILFATRLGVGLLLLGIVAAACSGYVPSSNESIVDPPWLLGALALTLAACVLAYDLLLKDTPIGPPTMAACRALNLSLGMTAAGWATFDVFAWAPIGMFVYIMSISFFGRNEAGQSSRARLIVGAAGIGLSLLCLVMIIAGLCPEDWFTLLLWFTLAVHLGRVTIRAIRFPGADMVQYAMKTFIFAIVAMNAVWAAAGAGWPAGVIVLSLLVPTTLLGRWLYAT